MKLYKPGEMQLPEPPADLEWVVQASAERFTVNLAWHPPKDDPEWDPANRGYLYSHTVKHPAVITQLDWEEQVANAAKWILTEYHESNQHAKWADEMMRRSR